MKQNNARKILTYNIKIEVSDDSITKSDLESLIFNAVSDKLAEECIDEATQGLLARVKSVD